MRRVVIRNHKNPKPVKPRLFDALVDGDDVYFEIKAKQSGSEIIALKDIMVALFVNNEKRGSIRWITPFVLF